MVDMFTCYTLVLKCFLQPLAKNVVFFTGIPLRFDIKHLSLFMVFNQSETVDVLVLWQADT